MSTDPSNESAVKPLRILIIVNLEWDSRLGAVRVYAELLDRWRAAGHLVEKFTLSDAFPNWRGSRAGFALRQVLFPYKAAAFLQKNAARFDVVDAIIGSLLCGKKKLGFQGLLVARSVGLYRLYDEFERSALDRWPDRPRGKWLGRIFYTQMRRFLTRASDASVRHADLINVPNKEEADFLRQEIGASRSIMVQPYGLTEERRQALLAAAAPARTRLAGKKIGFVGMWAPRKGSYEWSGIIRKVWARIPEARFTFLGTMVEGEKVLSDLGLPPSDRIELVSEYAPADLPGLLRDCAVGAFPSYVEGFGLAVLEQLAAGIPTVAFDVAGPRDMLGADLAGLRVARGDSEEFANAVCQILELDLPHYEELSGQSARAAKAFDWTKIAGDTIDAYRAGLKAGGPPILFVQPFSLGASGGGGGRILRALLENAPVAWRSVCCSPQRPKPWPNEIHLPTRPSWGRIERTRWSMYPKRTAAIFVRRFRRRLKALCERTKASAIHAVPHSGLDFMHAQEVARELALPFFISLHDDLAYTAVHEVRAAVREPAMRRAWLEADARFVISEALGQEYVHRYGERPYLVVTDGLKSLHAGRPESAGDVTRIYFMGLFHLAYERNLRALLEGLKIFEQEHPARKSTVTCRCEHIRPRVWRSLQQVEVLPYADEAQIERDMRDADILYMPMPFGQEHENFARYSVSTKMITYAGSGLPIIYHGPTNSAAFDLLKRNDAAIFITSLDPAEIANSFAKTSPNECRKVVANALALARREFMLADQTRKFWGTICGHLQSR